MELPSTSTTMTGRDCVMTSTSQSGSSLTAGIEMTGSKSPKIGTVGLETTVSVTSVVVETEHVE